MFEKLQFYGDSDGELAWFQSYFNNHLQCVFCEGKYSHYLEVNYGVPQGSILAPLNKCCLFILTI